MTKQMQCATKTAKWLASKELNLDVSIYVDHKRYSVSNQGDLVYDIDAEPRDYFDYAGDFMSMSFEGPLYEVINGTWEFKTYEKWENELTKLFKDFGMYYELGNAWNLSLYEI